MLALVAVVVGTHLGRLVNSLKPYQEGRVTASVSPNLMAPRNYGLVFAEGNWSKVFINNAIVWGSRSR